MGAPLRWEAELRCEVPSRCEVELRWDCPSRWEAELLWDRGKCDIELLWGKIKYVPLMVRSFKAQINKHNKFQNVLNASKYIKASSRSIIAGNRGRIYFSDPLHHIFRSNLSNPEFFTTIFFHWTPRSPPHHQPVIRHFLWQSENWTDLCDAGSSCEVELRCDGAWRFGSDLCRAPGAAAVWETDANCGWISYKQ